MSLQSVEKAGGISYAANLFARGYDEDAVYQSLVRAYHGESDATIELVIRDAGYAAYQGGLVAGLGPGQTLPAADIPGYYPGRTGFKYTVIAHWLDPATGADDYRTTVVSTTAQLDYASLQSTVAGSPPPAGIGGGIANRSGTIPQTWILDSIEVVSLERE